MAWRKTLIGLAALRAATGTEHSFLYLAERTEVNQKKKKLIKTDWSVSLPLPGGGVDQGRAVVDPCLSCALPDECFPSLPLEPLAALPAAGLKYSVDPVSETPSDNPPPPTQI